MEIPTFILTWQTNLGLAKNATNKCATNEHAVKRLNNLRTAGNIYEDSSNNTNQIIGAWAKIEIVI